MFLSKTSLTRPLKKMKTIAKYLVSMSLLAAAAMPAHALVINPVFDSGYNAEQKATVASAISFLESQVTDNVTFAINFNTSATGLGASSQALYGTTYSNVVAALNADRTSANDYLAMSHVAAGSADAATGKSLVLFTYAQCFALGFNCGAQMAGDIYINLGLVDSNRADGIESDKYDMFAVALHEMDEFLGVGGPASTVGTGYPYLGVEDLFRYTSAGVRSYTTTGDDAYFSIDGGTTMLARFNQNAWGDYADWWSTGPHTPSAQDAFGTPGVISNFNPAERVALDVVGWDLAPAQVPEPSTSMLVLPVLLGLGLRRRRTHKPD
jgi:hypothetical protein